MAKILISRDGQPVGQQFVSGERLVMGRLPDNQLTLEGAEIAERHAEILTLGSDHVLNDLGSESGTRINGERVKRRLLQHGDLIAIGRFEIKYVNRKAEESEWDRTLLIEPSGGSSQRAMPGIGAREVEQRLWAGALRKKAGDTRDLAQVITPLGTPGVQTAVIFRRPHGCFVAPVEGPPPKVNRQPIADELQLLNDGDVIEVAGEEFTFMRSSAHSTRAG